MNNKEPYTERELRLLFSELHEKIDRNNEVQVSRFDTLETEARKTNGRLSSLELWRSFLAGAMAVLSLLVLPLIFILIKSFL